MASELQALCKAWWDTPLPPDDPEARALDAWTEKLWPLPDWALQIRGAMPKWGFEMCSHRWLEGLEHTLAMVIDGVYAPSEAGHCGDIPFAVKSAAMARATDVARWMSGVPLGAEAESVQQWLGVPSHAKRVGATCLVEAVRYALGGPTDEAVWSKKVASWREACAPYPQLQPLFGEQGLQALLENACGFALLRQLDGYLRFIGGDASLAGELVYNCNGQLRFLWDTNLARYARTRAMLWGIQAALLGWNEETLRRSMPECADAACQVLGRIDPVDEDDAFRRWLLASLLVSAKAWCLRAIQRSAASQVPAWAHDLPALPAGATRNI